MNKTLSIIALVIILVADWLTFHDVHEVHTVRDWLMVVITVLIAISIFKSWQTGKSR